MIWKLIRRNVAGKPFRFLLTCSAVTAGVLFTVGVFVFTDGMRAEFEKLAESIEGGTDLAVRTQIEFGDDFSRPPFDPGVVDVIESTPGTVFVQPFVLQVGTVTLEDANGDSQSGPGAAVVALNWPDNSKDPRLFLIDGRAPSGPEEIAIDADAFEDGAFEIGGRYDLTVPAGRVSGYELVGVFNFGSPTVNELIGGARQVAFETQTAIDLLNQGAGLDRVEFSVSQDADRAQVMADVASALTAAYGTTLEVVEGEQLQEEQEDEFNEIISVFRTVLLTFAIIILAVSAFVIYNVFTILIGQRIRELGLMRAVGATGRQVTQALLGEAFIVGIASTVMGIAAGIGFGWSLGWLLGQLDFGPGNDNLVVTRWALLWGTVLGLGVTMASAIVPALRARHLSPMAALREDARLTRIVPTRNLLIGVPIVVIAWVLLGIGLAIGGDSSWPVWVVVPLFGFTAAFANSYGLRRIDGTVGRFAMLGFGVITIVLTVVLDLGVGELLLPPRRGSGNTVPRRQRDQPCTRPAGEQLDRSLAARHDARHRRRADRHRRRSRDTRGGGAPVVLDLHAHHGLRSNRDPGDPRFADPDGDRRSDSSPRRSRRGCVVHHGLAAHRGAHRPVPLRRRCRGRF